MAKYDVGELITVLNDAVNKLNNLRAKYDDVKKERDALRMALKKISFTARRKDETSEALLVVCDVISRAPLGEQS